MAERVVAAGEDEQGEAPRAPRTLLEDLSDDLSHVAALLAQLAERDAVRREQAAREGIAARQVRAVIAARHARSPVFGLDLANPGWTLLLELFAARLEAREVKAAALPVETLMAPSTVWRWLDLLCAAGHAVRVEEGERRRGVVVALTDTGADAMRDYFAAVAAGWD